jgi:hypothetical protein
VAFGIRVLSLHKIETFFKNKMISFRVPVKQTMKKQKLLKYQLYRGISLKKRKRLFPLL